MSNIIILDDHISGGPASNFGVVTVDDPYVAAKDELTGYALKIVRVLFRNSPSVRADRLMKAIGIDFDIYCHGFGGLTVYPHQAYVEFACAGARARQVLAKHGWHLHNPGGSIGDRIWMEKFH